MWFIYIVRCTDNTLYTGITTDTNRRLKEHNGKLIRGAAYTKLRRPVKLVYRQSTDTRSNALKRERAIKKLTRQQKELLILDSTNSL